MEKSTGQILRDIVQSLIEINGGSVQKEEIAGHLNKIYLDIEEAFPAETSQG